MKKSKKKTLLHPNSIHRQYGIEYQEDIPEFHIEGVKCTEEEYNEYAIEANKQSFKYSNSNIFKRKAQENFNKIFENKEK